MKKDKDFRIQELLDGKMLKGEHVAWEKMDVEDLEVYEVLYDHLKEKPEQGLSLSFKSDVLRRVEIEKKQASDSKFYWLLVVVSLVGVFVIASLFFVFKDSIAPSLGVLDRFKGFIFIGVVAIILFGAVERRSLGGAL